MVVLFYSRPGRRECMRVCAPECGAVVKNITDVLSGCTFAGRRGCMRVCAPECGAVVKNIL